MSFASLKKASKAGDTLSKLTREIEKLNTPTAGGGGADERLWKPELDKSGNGYAVIRFLPAPDGEDMPWAKVWSHAFKGPGGQWYIENSLTTLGKDDPVGELNRELWNSGKDSDKDRRGNSPTTLTSMLYLILLTQRMKEEYSFISTAKRFLINSLKQCNLHLLMRHH